MAWDPDLYLAFAGHRFRPALDLMAQVPLTDPMRIADLGCGTGNATEVMAKRWPDAAIFAVDSSEEMLAKAETETGKVRWIQADVGNWAPDGPLDLIYSNAALHWLTDHAALFPKLVGMLTSGGVLAVQMPRNYHAPGLALVNEVARQGPWAETLAPVIRPVPVEPPQFYYSLIAPLVTSLELWETEYIQVLEGENPVAKWTQSTWRGPLLAALDEPLRSQYDGEYKRRVLEAYPPGPDGKTLFPFRRMFMVARR
jgi:trans-aconitate 2-methyltransferase